RYRVSRRLSRMSACGSFAAPLITLIRSKTTRRSAPSTKSRLRSPTSKSMTTTFAPSCARAAPRAAVDVVLPTPPLPDVTTKTWDIFNPSLVYRRNSQHFSFEPSLGRLAPKIIGDVVCRLVVRIDCEELGFDATAKDTRAGITRRWRGRVAGRKCGSIRRLLLQRL